MVNVEKKTRAPNNTRTRSGGGKIKKCKVNKIDIVKTSTDPKNTTNKNTVQNGYESSDNNSQESRYLSITRSGRIRKKNKDSLKIMDNILKNELLIEDQAKKPKIVRLYKVNNNNINLSNQNKKSNKKSRKNGVSKSNGKKKENLSDKLSGKDMQPMEPQLRKEVIDQMKSALAPENDKDQVTNPEKTQSTKSPKSKTNKKDEKPKTTETRENNKRKCSDTDDVDTDKTKKVTLSNGVVLTLSLVKCDYCKKTFSNKQSLSRHVVGHLNIKQYSCSCCGKKFRYRSNLTKHTIKHHPGTIRDINQAPEYHMCNICDKTFVMQENLELHLASHVKSENNFQCMFCDKKFSYRILLTHHEKTHLTTNKFKCHTCDMSYDLRSELVVHLKSHKRVREYICQYCGKKFGRLSGIKRHVMVSHGGQRIQCPICMKKLKGHLTEHMRLHEQKRPHVCDECGQRFTQSTQLTVHKRSHTGQRPYLCKICQRPFGHSNALLMHIRRHTGEKPFACAMCPLSFSQLPHMKTHMSKIHGKDNAYRCHKCKEFFKLKADLESHLKTCTVGDKELSFEEKLQASLEYEEIEVESTLSLSKMRFLIALLLTMIASKDKLKVLGFNKRLIDELLEESLTAMGHKPCKDKTLSPLKRLKANIEILLKATVPENQMATFRSKNKTTEEILILLTEGNT